MADEICGAECVDGSQCQHLAGSCPVASHSDARPDGGRPTKFTDDRKAAILSAAENGTTVKGCARAAGIGESTLYEWLNEFSEFSESFKRARAKGEQELLDAAIVDDPKWVLERSYDYVKTERREHLVDDDADLAGEQPTADFVVIGGDENEDDEDDDGDE